MSDRRQDAATATLGLGGVAASGALAHSGLERAYAGQARPKFPFGHERVYLRRGKVAGRGRWAASAALGLVSVPPAAVGTSRLMRRKETTSKADDRKRSFLGEGLAGAKESFHERNASIAEKPPAKLVLGNYLAGAAVGSAAGGITHRLVGRTKLGGSARSGIARGVGIVAGSAALPLQSRLTNRASHGQYEVTPTGVRRKRAKPARPSSSAHVVEGRPGKTTLSPHALRQEMVGKMSPRAAANTAGAVVGAHWTTNLSRVADRVEPYAPRRAKPRPRPVIDRHLPNAKRVTGKLVATGRTKAAETLRAVSYDVSSLNDKDKLVREVASGQGAIRKDDPGASMSRGERRARVTASGGLPVVGDFTQAAQAARLSPEPYRRRTAAQNYAAGAGAGLAGNAAGAVGAAALAHRFVGFEQRANALNNKIEGAKTNVKARAGIKPSSGPGLGQRAGAQLERRAPRVAGAARATGARAAATRAGRLIAAHKGPAAVGALVGGSVIGQAGQQAMYGHIMSRDDRYRRQHNQGARRGSKAFAKADQSSGMSRREELEQIRRKRRAAAIAATTSTGSIAATGLLGGSLLPKVRHTPRAGKLRTASFATGTIAGGAAALNGLEGAHLQRRDLRAREQALVGKALLRPTGMRRAPSMRRGFIRQTRYPSGMIRTTTVRGGLS